CDVRHLRGRRRHLPQRRPAMDGGDASALRGKHTHPVHGRGALMIHHPIRAGMDAAALISLAASVVGYLPVMMSVLCGTAGFIWYSIQIYRAYKEWRAPK